MLTSKVSMPLQQARAPKGVKPQRSALFPLPFLLCLLPLLLTAAPTARSTPFCSDCEATRRSFKQLCDYIVAERSDFTANTSSARTIFTNGYYMRTLVAGFATFGERRYLDAAIRYGDYLLAKQSPRGYWGTGYGNIYLADTGSALGLFISLNRHVDQDRRKKYFEAIRRYVKAIEDDGLINPSGAIGTGYRADQEGNITGPYKDEYTISSALTGGEIFTWMYHTTRQEKYRRVAYNALRWVLGTMRDDGVIPYVLAGEGSPLDKKNDPAVDFRLWDRARYLTSAYVGEGVLSFDLYCNQRAWKAELRKKLKPHIEFLLRAQNPDGTWAVPDTKTAWDQKRSPGVVNLLIWWYEKVDRDPRVAAAVRKFDAFLLDPARAKAFGMLNAGAVVDSSVSSPQTRVDCVTGIGGRAVGDILMPLVDARW
jgi:hypothetical protein